MRPIDKIMYTPKRQLKFLLLPLLTFILVAVWSISAFAAPQQNAGAGDDDLNRNDSNKLKNPGDMRKNYTYADPNNAPFVPHQVHPMGRDVVEEQKSQGPGVVSHGGPEHDPIYKWPVVILEANSPVPTYRDMGIMDHRLRTFGLPISDTQYQMIHRYNQNIMLAEMFDPERVNWLLATTGNMQAQDAANTANNIERNQVASAIDFSASYLYNFTVDAGNRWNKIRDQLFIPMAFLLLLPGAVLAQVKVIVQAGSPVIGDSTSPFEGILRSIVAVFLIPATYLVINYGIDVANSITYTIAHEYERIFGSNMYRDALCAEIRAFPIRQAQENDNGIFKPSVPWNRLDPKGQKNETPAAKAESVSNANMIEDPCANKRIVPPERTDEAANIISTTQRLMSGGSNAALAATWNILCAFQMAYLYYLWCVGPVIAALWVYPMKQLRDAFPSWVEGVITICFWSLFWNTVILLLACFRGVDETGTVIISALNFLANACVKYAFDFAGLVKAAGQQAAGQAMGGAANAARSSSAASHGQGGKGSSASGSQTSRGGSSGGAGDEAGTLASGASTGVGAAGTTGGVATMANMSGGSAGGSTSLDSSSRVPANGTLSNLPTDSLANSGSNLLDSAATNMSAGFSGAPLPGATGSGFGNIGSPPPSASIDLTRSPFAPIGNMDNGVLPPSSLLGDNSTLSPLSMGMGALGLGATPFTSSQMDFGKGLPVIDGSKGDIANYLTSHPMPNIPTPSEIGGLKVDANYLSSWNQNWSSGMANNMMATSNSFNSWLSESNFDQSFKDKFKDELAGLNSQLGPIAGSSNANTLYPLSASANESASNIQLMAQQAAVAMQQQQYGQWQSMGQNWASTLSSDTTVSQAQLSQFQQFQTSFNDYMQNARNGLSTTDLNNWSQRIQGLQIDQAQVSTAGVGLAIPIAGQQMANPQAIMTAHNDAQLIAQQANSQAQQLLPPSSTTSPTYSNIFGDSSTITQGSLGVGGTTYGAPTPGSSYSTVNTGQVFGDNYSNNVNQVNSHSQPIIPVGSNNITQPDNIIANNSTGGPTASNPLTSNPVGSPFNTDMNMTIIPANAGSSILQPKEQQANIVSSDMVNTNAYQQPANNSSSYNSSDSYNAANYSQANGLPTASDVYQNAFGSNFASSGSGSSNAEPPQYVQSSYAPPVDNSLPPQYTQSGYAAPTDNTSQYMQNNYAVPLENITPQNNFAGSTPIVSDQYMPSSGYSEPIVSSTDHVYPFQPVETQYPVDTNSGTYSGGINSGQIMSAGIVAASAGAAFGYAYGNQSSPTPQDIRSNRLPPSSAPPAKGMVSNSQPTVNSAKPSTSRALSSGTSYAAYSANNRNASSPPSNALTRALGPAASRPKSVPVENYTSYSAPVQKRNDSPFGEIHLTSLRNKSSSINKEKLKEDLDEFAEDMNWNI